MEYGRLLPTFRRNIEPTAYVFRTLPPCKCRQYLWIRMLGKHVHEKRIFKQKNRDKNMKHSNLLTTFSVRTFGERSLSFTKFYSSSSSSLARQPCVGPGLLQELPPVFSIKILLMVTKKETRDIAVLFKL
jgi:hypothetical protein